MMRYPFHVLSWLFLVSGVGMMIEHLPPGGWAGETQTLLLGVVNRIVFIVAGLGLARLGAAGVYVTRAVLSEAEADLVSISHAKLEETPEL